MPDPAKVPSILRTLFSWDGVGDHEQSKFRLLERRQHFGEVLSTAPSRMERLPKSALNDSPVLLSDQMRVHKHSAARLLLDAF